MNSMLMRPGQLWQYKGGGKEYFYWSGIDSRGHNALMSSIIKPEECILILDIPPHTYISALWLTERKKVFIPKSRCSCFMWLANGDEYNPKFESQL